MTIELGGLKFKDPSDLHNVHRGSHCFLFGGGETIRDWISNGLNIVKLIKTEYTFGINKSYLIGASTYHTCLDLHYWSTDKERLKKLNTTFILPQSICTNDKVTNAYLLKNKSKGDDIIPYDFKEGIYYGRSSGFVALVCAYLMGFNPIYLLGFDLHGKHFHEGYGIEKDKRLDSDHAVIKNAMIEGIEILIKRGISIISLSPTSKLNTIIPFNYEVLYPYLKVQEVAGVNT